MKSRDKVVCVNADVLPIGTVGVVTRVTTAKNVKDETRHLVWVRIAQRYARPKLYNRASWSLIEDSK